MAEIIPLGYFVSDEKLLDMVVENSGPSISDDDAIYFAMFKVYTC